MKVYMWEDRNDPHATGVPDLEEGSKYTSKKGALENFAVYAAYSGVFSWTPKIRLWRVKVEEVKV